MARKRKKPKKSAPQERKRKKPKKSAPQERKRKKPKKSAPQERKRKKRRESGKRRKPRQSKPKPRKSTKRAYEKRPKIKPTESYGPPEGFNIDVAAVASDEAAAAITARLEDAKSRLPEGYSGRVLVHVYADGSVDGELYVRVPDDVSDMDAEFDMHESFTSISAGRNFWISVGARYELRADDERYRRFKGLTQVGTNYQRATRSNITETHLILRNKIMGGMDRKFGLSAHSVFVRLHWNVENVQPQR